MPNIGDNMNMMPIMDNMHMMPNVGNNMNMMPIMGNNMHIMNNIENNMNMMPIMGNNMMNGQLRNIMPNFNLMIDEE